MLQKYSTKLETERKNLELGELEEELNDFVLWLSKNK